MCCVQHDRSSKLASQQVFAHLTTPSLDCLRARDANAPPAKRLRDRLVDLYGTGAVPADAVQGLLDDAGAYADEGGRDDFQD